MTVTRVLEEGGGNDDFVVLMTLAVCFLSCYIFDDSGVNLFDYLSYFFAPNARGVFYVTLLSTWRNLIMILDCSV